MAGILIVLAIAGWTIWSLIRHFRGKNCGCGGDCSRCSGCGK